MKSHRAALVIVSALFASICAHGFAEPTTASATQAADAGTDPRESADEKKQQSDPIAALSRIGFEDWYTDRYHQEPGAGNEVVFRAITAFDLGQFDSITRLTIPSVTSSPPKGGLGADSANQTETPSGPTGLGDIELYDLLVLKTQRGRFTVGPTFSFPTARNSANGSGKWEVGPAAGFTMQPPHWHLGFFTESFFSFAGDSDAKTVAKSKIQPILYYNFPRGWSLGVSTMNFAYNWESHDWTNLPIGMRIGKLIPIGTETIDASVEGEYNFHDSDGAAAWTVRLKLYLIFPSR